MSPTKYVFTLAAAICVVFAGCSAPRGESVGTGTQACVSNFNAATDYFPQKANFEFAQGVKVSYHKSYKKVTLPEPTKGGKPATYILYHCGAPKPTSETADAMIEVPVKRVASASTTQLTPLDMLGRTDTIVGVNGTTNVSNEKVRQRIEAKQISDFGTESQQLDVEKTVALRADVIWASGFEDPTWVKLKQSQQPLVADAAWLESHPLARAEWIKFFGLFYNQEAAAATTFDAMKAQYQQVVDKLNGAPKTTVLAGSSFQGKWTVPGSQSYVAQFLRDAGGDYVFAEEQGKGSVNVDVEKVLSTGTKATVWVNGNAMASKKWKTLADVVASDARLANLPAVSSGQVWNPTKRRGAGGGNLYWEEGVSNPGPVLADLAAILHPERFTDHQFTYYEKIGG